MSASSQKDYYEILGLDSKANQQAIKEAYRKLAFQYHPDRNKDDPSASEKMKALNEAYAILSDPAKRRDYDFLREQYGPMAYDQYRQSHSQEDIFRGSDINQVFQEFARSFGFRNADEIFREFYGPAFRGYEYRRPGFTVRSFVYNPGRSGQANAGSSLPSVRLGWFGRLLKFFLEKAFHVQIAEQGQDLKDSLDIDPEAAVAGGEVEYHYRKLGQAKTLMIRIPSGIKNGQRIRLRGLGSPGKAGGPPGDMLLKINLGTSLWRKILLFFKYLF